MGQDKNEPDYVSFQFSSAQSPFFKDWNAVQRLPQRIFQQEYEAKFIDDGGEAFRNIRDCVKR